MKEKFITVLKVEPGKNPVVTILENKLEKLQDAVAIGAPFPGLIELFSIDDNVSILCNEEGKLIGLKGNRHFCDDLLCGVFYIVGDDEEGNLTSLSPDMIEKYSKLFWEPEDISADEVSDAIFIGFFHTEEQP